MGALTQERLKALLDYNPETGIFRWRVARGRQPKGAVAGLLKDSIRFVRLEGVTYPAHRLAWLWMTGTWPKNRLLHRDGTPGNNAWGNLREVTKRKITYDLIRELFNYDPENGILTWREAWGLGGRFPAGAVAGRKTRWYLNVVVDRRSYMVHRVIWFWMTGAWPTHEVDHINGNGSDNRWINLRSATHAENQQNLKMQKNNTSGLTGVSWHNKVSKWRAVIAVNGRSRHLGYFANPELAYAAYLEAKTNLHPFQPKPRDR